MTTVWRPHVRREIPNSDDAKVEVEVPEEVNKGVKRKRAPPTKGPCEHGVKYRSKCKVCSACPHGRQRSHARSAAGLEYASTVVSALTARSAVVHQSASTVVGASVQGVRWGINLRARSSALSVQGVRWCINLRARSSALRCKECGGSGICEHGRQRSQCKECGGGAICEHGRRRSHARSAVGHQSASTVVGALVQGVRWGESASTRRASCKECRGA